MSLSNSLQRSFRYRSNDEGASLRLGMAYGMLFNMISAVYHVHVRLNVLHLLCVCIGLTKYCCRTAYKGVSASVATMKERALGKDSIWYALQHHIFSLSCSCLTECVTFTMCLHRTD